MSKAQFLREYKLVVVGGGGSSMPLATSDCPANDIGNEMENLVLILYLYL
ncbi:29174_t:CDS:2, partial [Racocetra persica]